MCVTDLVGGFSILCLPDLCEHPCGMGLSNKCLNFTMIFRKTESEGYCGPVGTPFQIKKQNRSSVQHSPCTAQSHRPPLSVMRPKKTTARLRLMNQRWPHVVVPNKPIGSFH